MLGLPDLFPILNIATIFVAILSISSIKYNITDTIVVLWISYCLVSSLWSNNLELSYLGFKAEVVPILFYFIARSKFGSRNDFLDNMRYPLLFSFVCALVLYIFPPSWYTAFKIQNIDANMSEHMIYENTRLSGFWIWSYFIGYSSLFYIMYLTKKKIIDENSNSIFLLEIVIAAICLFLAQQRVSIAFFFLFFLATIFYAKKTGRSANQLIYITIGILGAGVIIYLLLISFFDSGLTDYILDRTVNKEENMVTERFDMFSVFYNKISFFGTGLGTVGHNVYYLTGEFTIADCDYLRIPVEYGVFGSFILLLIVVKTLFRGLRSINNNWFNLSVLLFMLVSMLGAAPLELYTLQPYLYWYCIGQINRPLLRISNSKSMINK